jgi:DNA-directed RNA polymerase subunit RPC12/RpoP
MLDQIESSMNALCPKCGSSQIKKSFFGGSKGAAFACFILGGLITVESLSQGDFSVLFLSAVFALAGIAALVGKKYKCIQCKSTFS